MTEEIINTKTEDDSSKKTRIVNFYNAITGTARRNFNQMAKRVGMKNFSDKVRVSIKREAILNAINENSHKQSRGFYNRTQFMSDFKNQVNYLINMNYFQDYCRRNGAEKEMKNVASHVVLLGISAIKKHVVDDVISKGYIDLEFEKLWKLPLFTEEELDGRFLQDPTQVA